MRVQMSTEATAGGEPFDLDKLRELVAMMDQHGLSEIDLRRGDQRWRLRRGPSDVMQMVPAGYAHAPMQSAPPAAVAASSAPAAAEPAKPVADGVPIKSPTVGTFYVAAAPGDEPFVSVGSRVTSETVVCVIEAMKVFNQIAAEVNGTITEVLAKNGDPVEFGQPLFRVRLG